MYLQIFIAYWFLLVFEKNKPESNDIVCVDLHSLQVLVGLLVGLLLVGLLRWLCLLGLWRTLPVSTGCNVVGPLGIDDPTGTTG